MGPVSTPPPFRPPRQRRSAQTLDRIVTATEELLSERAFERATVDDIVARAGSSKGSFYARFADKEALLAYLGEDALERAKQSYTEHLDPKALRDVPLRTILERFIGRIVEGYRTSPPVLRALFIESRLHPQAEFARMTRELDAHVTKMLERLLRQRSGERTHPSPATAATYAMLLVDTTAREAVLFAGSPPERDAELRRELARALAGYLGVS
jgi:AcrR family transcriptional regulator